MTDSESNTALHYAACHSHLGVCRLLIAAGVDVNERNNAKIIYDENYRIVRVPIHVSIEVTNLFCMALHVHTNN